MATGFYVTPYLCCPAAKLISNKIITASTVPFPSPVLTNKSNPLENNSHHIWICIQRPGCWAPNKARVEGFCAAVRGRSYLLKKIFHLVRKKILKVIFVIEMNLITGFNNVSGWDKRRAENRFACRRRRRAWGQDITGLWRNSDLFLSCRGMILLKLRNVLMLSRRSYILSEFILGKATGKIFRQLQDTLKRKVTASYKL